jgi:cysteine desulfurase
MGAPPAAARASLRFSLGRTTTGAEVADVLNAIEPVVARSRSAATRRARVL